MPSELRPLGGDVDVGGCRGILGVGICTDVEDSCVVSKHHYKQKNKEENDNIMMR